MKTDNNYAYHCLGNVLNNADDGFYLLIASPAMQSEVIAHYSSTPVAVVDCTQWDGEYSIKILKNLFPTIPTLLLISSKIFNPSFFKRQKRKYSKAI